MAGYGVRGTGFGVDSRAEFVGFLLKLQSY